MPNYMDALLEELRTQFDVRDPDALARIREELIRSFKNGIMRGRELARGPRQDGRDEARGTREVGRSPPTAGGFFFARLETQEEFGRRPPDRRL